MRLKALCKKVLIGLGCAGFVAVSYAQDRSLTIASVPISLGMKGEDVFQALGGIESKTGISATGLMLFQTGHGRSGIAWNEGPERVISISYEGDIRLKAGIVTAVTKTWNYPEGNEQTEAWSFAKTLFNMMSGVTSETPSNAAVKTFRKVSPDDERECLEICRGNHCYGFCAATGTVRAGGSETTARRAYIYEK